MGSARDKRRSVRAGLNGNQSLITLTGGHHAFPWPCWFLDFDIHIIDVYPVSLGRGTVI